MAELDFVRVFAAGNPLLVSHIANLLESAGIPVERRNQVLGGAAGELPPGECEPEVWVAPHNRSRAEALIQRSQDGGDQGPPWRCPGCGERLEGAFDTCWQCGQSRA
ncbi:MAG TPA: DUF2007 domain-containing protein [Halomonas sp.]|nr:DUF2007 domain-containing protein [Halomonas sp.]